MYQHRSMLIYELLFAYNASTNAKLADIKCILKYVEMIQLT